MEEIEGTRKLDGKMCLYCTVRPPDSVQTLRDGNQGKHRVTKRGPALSYPMFTLVTGIVGRWRAYKSKEDTWSTEELKKHLKTMQSDSGNDRRHKERSHHRQDEEHTQRKHRPDEKRDKRERPKDQGRDGHAEKGKGDHQEQRREKEKARERDKDKYRVSERHRTNDREKTSDKVDTGEKPVKEYGTYDLGREERKLRDSHEKRKHRNEDRERRHEERREKEGRKRESEEHEDRKQRHRKESEVFTSHDADRERRRSDRRYREASDREKRHHSRQEKGTPSDEKSPEDPVLYSDRAKEKPSTEGYTHGDKEQRHRDKKDRRTRAHERMKTDSQTVQEESREAERSAGGQTAHGIQGKHRVTKRGPALSYPMFTLVTGIVGRWRAVCVTALQRPNSDAAAIRIVVGIAAASLNENISSSKSHSKLLLAKAESNDEKSLSLYAWLSHLCPRMHGCPIPVLGCMALPVPILVCMALPVPIIVCMAPQSLSWYAWLLIPMYDSCEKKHLIYLPALPQWHCILFQPPAALPAKRSRGPAH
ncbi:unnamed protein product [Ranitomeya imitator]|uniref:Uncharacterized protein n=1 Tax=Ranitomeya imitator TaxID=111125 RepID=A0ABN9LV14_9NEOB|nr:unnamed protein product [Ranitomeya imitator]